MPSSDPTLTRTGLRFVLFLMPLLLVGAVVEQWLRAIPTQFSIKASSIEAKRDSIQVLVVGSSNTANGIQPKFFRVPGFNLGFPAQSVWYDAQFALKYQHLPNLKLVIFGLHYPTIKERLSDTPDSYRQFFYERFSGLPPEELADVFDIRRLSITPIYANLALRGANFGNSKVDEFGWMPNEGLLTNPSDAGAQARLTYLKTIMKDSNVKRNVEILSGTVETLRKNNVQVALIILPVTNAFVRNANSVELDLVVETIELLSKKYGILTKNYLESDRFMNQDFSDYDHLNPNGAAKLSRIIDEELVGPAITGSPLN